MGNARGEGCQPKGSSTFGYGKADGEIRQKPQAYPQVNNAQLLKTWIL